MTNEQNRNSIILDTNFLIENIKRLEDTYGKLSETFDVYVTEVSIEERISQKYRSAKLAYSEIEGFQEKYKKYVDINIKSTFEKYIEKEKQHTQKGYVNLFKNKIIPFVSSNEIFKVVMERAYRKTPPFNPNQNSSDKGFKDTLMWMSMLDFFSKKKGDYSITLVTNDGIFSSQAEKLCDEFMRITGHKIEIKKNDFVYDLVSDKKQDEIIEEVETTHSNTENLRSRLAIINENIFTVYDSKTFSRKPRFLTSDLLDNESLRDALNGMELIKNEHSLENHISINDIFPELKFEAYYLINMTDIDDLLNYYNDIQSKYPEFMKPFLNAVCSAFNRNYSSLIITPDDMPF